MILVNAIHKNPIRDQVMTCFKNASIALSRGQPDVLRVSKFHILRCCLNEDTVFNLALDEPGFNYWILRIGLLCNTEFYYSLDNNLKLFEAWLFVIVNK